MTKQEILKAIKNGDSLWYVFFNEVCELKTSEHTNKFISRSDDYCYTDKKGTDRCAPLDMLLKSKGEAEHYLNHQYVTRTETLPFLTWEEFDNGNRLIRFIGKNGEKCKLEGYSNDEKQSGFIDVVVNGTGSHIDYDYTEEDFYKAYDECVSLFIGE